MTDTLLIGLDAASQRNKFGYALGTLTSGGVEIEAAGCIREQSARQSCGLDLLFEAIRTRGRTTRVVVAIDAPLGWPTDLSAALTSHRAGERIAVGKDSMFRRYTERLIRSNGGHQPLEIGADRIARAAHEALSVLAELRRGAEMTLPLLWDPATPESGVVEVYPAATLRANGLPSSGYKKSEQVGARRVLAEAISGRVNGLDRYVVGSIDCFDACLCLLSALDFVEGKCQVPLESERQAAEREGWIWVRRP